jgi:hydrogenase-4 membrane subunit HyfE
MLLLTLFYLVAITILVMHFTGFLERHNMEWIVLVLAASIVPALIYL